MRTPRTPSGRARIAESNRKRIGKVVSQETRRKLSLVSLGKKRSEETCAKLAASNHRRRLSKETRLKLSVANIGRRASDATRAKMSASKTGRRLSAIARTNIAKAKRGSRNPAWEGGIAHLPYATSFSGELRESVRRRDGYRCQLCGVPQIECDKALAIHHIDYDKKNSDPVNLVPLCNTCHARTSANRRHWTAFFRASLLKRHVGFQLPLPFEEVPNKRIE
jgi:hypothetical protein